LPTNICGEEKKRVEFWDGIVSFLPRSRFWRRGQLIEFSQSRNAFTSKAKQFDGSRLAQHYQIGFWRFAYA
jgi:hypothetical protein